MTDDHQTAFAGNGTGEAPAKKNLPRDARGIIADAKSDITIPFFSNILQAVDATIAKKGGAKGLKIYDEIEQDTHAWAVLQKRKKVLIAREWEVRPGGEDQRDLDAAEFVEGVLQRLPFDRICEELLDATLKGFAVSEIVWMRDGNVIAPQKIVTHEQRRFVFDLEWQLRLLTRENMIEGRALPERKFIVHRHGVKGNNPYGLGLGTRLFWPVLFKREGVSFWLTFLEKFAAPTVHGKVPYGLPEAEEAKLMASLAASSKQAAIVTPLGTEIDLLEAARSGSVSYEAWCKYWDNQISICVNGETLTTDVQDKGARAAGEVHADMLQMLVDADADLLADTLCDTLIRWLVEYNLPGAALPSVWRLRPANELAEAEAQNKRAEADQKRDEALRQVVATSAKFEDDRDARLYIQTMAGAVEPELLDKLVQARHSFATPDTPPKKKDLTSEDDEDGGADTIGFAEHRSTDDDVMSAMTGQLEAMGAEWDADRLSRVLAVLDSAKTLEKAQRALLREGAGWAADGYAETLALALNAAAYAGRDAVLQEVAGTDDAGDEPGLTGDFADAAAFNQPFKEQIDFFRQKAPRPTAEWTDILRGDHDRAFVIAGAKDRDMLADFQEAIAKAIEEGRTLEDFRKDFDQIVAKYGWSYKGERGWRTRTIFETNVRTSYMAGRLKQMRDPDVVKMRPFWQYRHGQTRKPKMPRREHQAWHGLVLRWDDPWWDLHFPPNGWRCSCGVRTLSMRDLKRMGKDGPDDAPPNRVKTIIDKKRGGFVDQPAGLEYGFEYAPGDLWERGLVPSQQDRLAVRSPFTVDDAVPVDALMASGTPFKAGQLPSGRDAEFYVDAFLSSFGAAQGKAALFTDASGTAVPISDEMFRDAQGALKITKRGREVYAAQLAETIKDPDEIWVGVASVRIPEDQGGGEELVIDRKYIRVDPNTGLLAIFELLKGRWTAKTGFKPTKKNSTATAVNTIQKRRTGVLVFKRGGGE